MIRITLQDIINDKKLSNDELVKDLTTLRMCKTDENKIKFCGNKILYHFQMENLLRTRVIGKRKTLPEILEDEKDYTTLERYVIRLKRSGTMANRFYEAFRLNQAVVFFKPYTAKFIYKYYGATHVLDPTAGWGGRMLGASSLGIHYTGIDTNLSLKSAYDGIMGLLKDDKMTMIWDNTLNVDYENIDYDFVLTSTPYVKGNKLVEEYEHQTTYNEFYDEFLIPLITKCLKYIKRNGKVCFNMNREMYEIVALKFRECNETLDLPQQKRLGKNKKEKIYVWW